MLVYESLQLLQRILQDDIRITFVGLLLGVPFLTYALTSLQSWFAIRSSKSGKRPAVVPYFIPFVGNLASFLWDVPGFAQSLTRRFGFETPLRVRMGPFKAYVISQASHFDSILRGGRELTSEHGVVFWMETLFATPKDQAAHYYEDNSGIAETPAPGSHVLPHNRHFFLRRQAASTFLYGTHLYGMTERFVRRFGQQIKDNKEVQYEWVEFPDLIDYLQREIFRAATGSLCGDYIFSLNPGFEDDFLDFVNGLGTLFKGVPRWWNKRPYEARDRALAAIKKFHLHAWEKTEHGKLDHGDHDPYFGAKIVKARYQFMKNIQWMNDDARASEDLALIFATNANAVPAAIWFIIEFLRDPELLQRVQNEVDAARIAPEDGQIRFDVAKLCSGVLLQSVLHETLRLRIAFEIIRVPVNKDYSLGKWSIPRGGLMFLSSAVAARNQDLWNSGDASDPHPLDEFWSDRFIIYPDDPHSGPVKRGANVASDADRKDQTHQQPRFSMEGLQGGFIPFGGGLRMCPGRFFAKNEMVATFAMFISNFEIELKTPKDWVPKPDTRFYGVGAMPPAGKIPFRIRRRRLDL